MATASRRQRFTALAISLLVVAITIAAWFVATVQLPEISAFLPIYTTIAAGGDGITAFLLLTQARIGRSWSLFILSAAYLYSAVTIVPHLLTFPHVFSATGLLWAGPQTAIWFWVWWHGGFALLVLAYVVCEYFAPQAESIGPRTVILGGALILATVAALWWITTHFHTAMPTLIQHGHYRLLLSTGIGPAILVIIALALTSLIAVTRLRNVTHLWLAVALVAALCECALTLFAGGRYTIGWYLSRVGSVFVSTIVLITYLQAIDQTFRRLARLSHVDGLTGIANRRSFDEVLERQVGIARRTASALSLVLIDVDLFKAYNDTYGHPSGDEALRLVAEMITSELPRSVDFAARYGGEEFVVLLPATDPAGASRVAERIRASVARRSLVHAAAPGRILTVSAGVATIYGNEPLATGDFLLERADASLYRAKSGGRNCVSNADLATA